MHHLLLMRHAKAERAKDDQSDHGRALAESGIAAAKRIRRKLKVLSIEPDVVLVSSARRTRETLACILNAHMAPRVDVLDSLYMAPASRVIKLLHELRETANSVLVIGHNPGIGELAAQLATADAESQSARRLTEGFPTARVADFLVLTPWRQLHPNGVRLQRLIDPND